MGAGTELGGGWNRTGWGLGLYWAGAGTELGRAWDRTGQGLGLNWGRGWDRTGRGLGPNWAGAGTELLNLKKNDSVRKPYFIGLLLQWPSTHGPQADQPHIYRANQRKGREPKRGTGGHEGQG